MTIRKLSNSELGRKSLSEFKSAQKMPVVILLDNVRSFHNVGAIFRSADAFMISELLLCGITPQPPHRNIHKTALGATESVGWKYYKDAAGVLAEYSKQGYTSLAVEQCEGSTMLNELEVDTSAKYLMIFGNEVEGVQQELVSACDGCLEIPQSGTKHSLNIAVSVGLLSWKFYQAFLI